MDDSAAADAPTLFSAETHDSLEKMLNISVVNGGFAVDGKMKHTEPTLQTLLAASDRAADARSTNPRERYR